jgi:amidase
VTSSPPSPDADATELLAQLARRDRSAAELLGGAIAAIDARNPAINAVVRTTTDAGDHRTSVPPSGPLAGLPTLLKDLGASIAGERLYQGNRLLRRLDWRATEDSAIARRVVDAGAVVLGRTNTPEFAAGVDTQPLSYGPTRNPHDLDRSVSGSSGGSAAAVAAGLVPFAHGNDFGGSIRLPAAWCSVVGLKPSRGLVSTAPTPPGPMAEFFLTRSLRDAALLLDAVADGATDWRETIRRDPPPLRIGVLTAVDGVDTDDGLGLVAHRAAAELAGAGGHELVDLPSTFLADERWDQQQRIVRAKGSKGRLDALGRLVDRPLTTEDVDPLLWALAAEADTIDDETHRAAGQWQLDFAAALEARWQAAGIDLLVSPTAGVRPMRLDELRPDPDDPVSIYATYRRIGCFAGPWNMVGFAAISVPSGELGVGVQVVGPVGRDDLVLQLARQLSEPAPPSPAATPTAERPTPRT